MCGFSSIILSLSRKSDAGVLYVRQGALTRKAAKFAEKPCAGAVGTGSYNAVIGKPHIPDNELLLRYPFGK